MSKTSTLRRLVDQALADRDTTLEEFITQGKADGKTARAIGDELRFVTGIPVPERTSYRWISEEYEAAS